MINNNFRYRFDRSLENPLFIGILFLLYIGLFAPPEWQPGLEAYSKYGVSGLLKKYGDFVVPSATFITLYGRLFMFFDFPLSVQIEHIVTTLIALFSINIFLKNYVSNSIALLFVLAWAPSLWEFESAMRLLGISFCILYLCSTSKIFSKGIFPLFLVIACLFEPAYIFILVFHSLFNFWKLIRERKVFIFSHWYPKQVFSFVIIILVFAVSITKQSDGDYSDMDAYDNNIYQFTYPYSPIELKGALNVSSLQQVTDFLSKRDTEKQNWYKQDWYFTYPLYFGDSKNLIEAITNYPHIFLKYSMMRIYGGRFIPIQLLFGEYLPYIDSLYSIRNIYTIMIYLLIALGVFNLFLDSVKKRDYRFIFLGIGIIPIILALSLTHIRFRYAFTLFPFILYLMANSGLGLIKVRALNTFFGENVKKLSSYIIVVISVVLMISTLSVKGSFNISRHNNPLLLFGPANQFSYIRDGLSLFDGIDEKTKILSMEAAWIKTFSKANFDNVYELLYLPPFSDNSGETLKFLKNLDQIWISNHMRGKRASLATQEYLRYELHLLPFENNYLQYGFTKVEIENYGTIYYKESIE